MPKHVSCGLMFGDPLAIPVPDLDRTDFLLMLGANPLESNGSLATAADWPGRLKALKARGGRLVVVDPRNTRTAAMADTHLAVRPGTDSYLLAAIALEILSSGSVDSGDLGALGVLADRVSGLEELPEMLADFTPNVAARVCGIPARRSRGSHGTWRPRQRPPYTGGSAPRPPSSALSRPGSSTSSTC